MSSHSLVFLRYALVVASTACAAAPDPAAVATADAGAAAADGAQDAPVAADAAADVPAADVPAGPELPVPRAYAGTCPDFAAGSNQLESMGFQRRFELFLPPEPKGAPLVFVWHGLGGNAKEIAAYLQAKKAAASSGAVVVSADTCCNHADNKGCCTNATAWGFFQKPDADLALFDDLLACLDQRFEIDRNRVYTTGFSAGALWSTYLVLHRAHYLAAAVLWSGGVNDFLAYARPERPLPVLVAWGGPGDTFGNGLIDFEASAIAVTAALRKDGHFILGCNHGLGHSVPASGPVWGLDFLLQHTWVDTASPFAKELGSGFPKYCKVEP